MINTTIGKYKITRLIGEGGMASVYEAEHEMLGTKVAVKVLNPVLSANAQIRERFKNEAKMMASFNHPNITKIIDFDDQPHQLSIVMEFLEGEDLNDKIKRIGPLSQQEVKDIFVQTLSAFQYAHEKGVVHRDIKPSNIYVLPNGHVKILDFGIAKLFGQGNEMTQTGTQMGTPVYMSPEQVRADKSIDHRSDIYSLGVTMFYAITGKPPYNSDTDSQFDIFNKIVFEPLPELPDIGNFDDFVKMACQKDREQRFQSCQDWLDSLTDDVVLSKIENKEKIVDTKDIPNSKLSSLVKETSGELNDSINNTYDNLQVSKSVGKNKFFKLTILGLSAIGVVILFYFIVNKNNSGPNSVKEANGDNITEENLSESKYEDSTLNNSQIESSSVYEKKDTMMVKVPESNISPAEKMLIGNKTFGTHWIEPYGKVEITKRGSELKIVGNQSRNDEFCSINGAIRVIDDRNFSFTGKIALRHNTSTYDSNTGQFPAVTEDKVISGTFKFRRVGGRPYWRLKQPDTPTGYFDYSYHYIDIFMN